LDTYSSDWIFIHPKKFMSKTTRHKAILDLLDDGPVESQEALQHILERKGIEVGQATLSRDIRELKLVKGPDGYRRATERSVAEGVLPSVMRMAHQFVLEVRQAQNMLVVKTTVGSAQPVAAALDASHWPEVVGTIAGDDTVLVIAEDTKKAASLARRIQEQG
jgi:transcriptional regulator of arginine metabolism